MASTGVLRAPLTFQMQLQPSCHLKSYSLVLPSFFFFFEVQFMQHKINHFKIRIPWHSESSQSCTNTISISSSSTSITRAKPHTIKQPPPTPGPGECPSAVSTELPLLEASYGSRCHACCGHGFLGWHHAPEAPRVVGYMSTWLHLRTHVHVPTCSRGTDHSGRWTFGSFPSDVLLKVVGNRW